MRWEVVFGVLLSVSWASQAQSPGAAELLQKVSATYRSIQDYEIAVQHHRTSGKRPIQTDHAADEAHADPSVVSGMAAQVAPVTSIVIARSGKKFYFQSGNATWKDPNLWMTDSRTTWHYLHGLNKYTEEPAEPWPARPGESRGLPGIEWKYFGRFRVVESVKDRATLVKENVPASGVCTATTSIVDMS